MARMTFKELRETMNGFMGPTDGGSVFKDTLYKLMQPFIDTVEPGYFAAVAPEVVDPDPKPVLTLAADTYTPISVLTDTFIDTEGYDWDPATASLTSKHFAVLYCSFNLTGKMDTNSQNELGLLRDGKELPYFDDGKGKGGKRNSVGLGGCLLDLEPGETLQFVGIGQGAEVNWTVEHAYISALLMPTIVGPGYTPGSTKQMRLYR